jgi:hypothetical protein
LRGGGGANLKGSFLNVTVKGHLTIRSNLC